MAAVMRGCGTRIEGGIYITCPQSRNGKPVEWFLMDPPIPIDPALGISSVGTKLIERDGVVHVFDIIGREHYPNVADFIEETRRYGLSRRIANTSDFSLLTEGSRIILGHMHGIIENHLAYWPRPVYSSEEQKQLSGQMAYRYQPWCPKSAAEHAHKDFSKVSHCAGLWWEDVPEVDIDFDPDSNPRAGTRQFVNISYRAARPPDEEQPRHIPAFIASFPIAQISVIRDRNGGKHEKAMEAASKSSLPVTLEDE